MAFATCEYNSTVDPFLKELSEGEHPRLKWEHINKMRQKFESRNNLHKLSRSTFLRYGNCNILFLISMSQRSDLISGNNESSLKQAYNSACLKLPRNFVRLYRTITSAVNIKSHKDIDGEKSSMPLGNLMSFGGLGSKAKRNLETFSVI